jgi:uncharacterized protein (TIGR03085 family)
LRWVSDSPAPLSRTERAALADLLEQLGPDQPTCCEGWTTRHLAAHLVVRDRRADAMPGLALGGPLAAWSQRVESRTRTGREYDRLVEEVRSGPPAWAPTAWPALDRVLNSVEMVIHHEDVRRAQPGWSPRELPRGVQDQLWSSVPFLARGREASRPAGGFVVRRDDVAAGTPGAERRLREGEPVTTVVGAPLEVLLWVSGRREFARVQVEG